MDEPLRRRFAGPGWLCDEAPSSNSVLDGGDVVEVEQLPGARYALWSMYRVSGDIGRFEV